MAYNVSYATIQIQLAANSNPASDRVPSGQYKRQFIAGGIKLSISPDAANLTIETHALATKIIFQGNKNVWLIVLCIKDITFLFMKLASNKVLDDAGK